MGLQEKSSPQARSRTLAVQLVELLVAPSEEPWAEWAETSYLTLLGSEITRSVRTRSCSEAWEVSVARILLLTPQAQREFACVAASASESSQPPLIPLLSIPPLYGSRFPLHATTS